MKQNGHCEANSNQVIQQKVQSKKTVAFYPAFRSSIATVTFENCEKCKARRKYSPTHCFHKSQPFVFYPLNAAETMAAAETTTKGTAAATAKAALPHPKSAMTEESAAANGNPHSRRNSRNTARTGARGEKNTDTDILLVSRTLLLSDQCKGNSSSYDGLLLKD